MACIKRMGLFSEGNNYVNCMHGVILRQNQSEFGSNFKAHD